MQIIYFFEQMYNNLLLSGLQVLLYIINIHV